jgi:hypothetical protein
MATRRTSSLERSGAPLVGPLLVRVGHIDRLRETAGKQIGALSSEWGRANTVLVAQFGP